jgi:hypothetical protein
MNRVSDDVVESLDGKLFPLIRFKSPGGEAFGAKDAKVKVSAKSAIDLEDWKAGNQVHELLVGHLEAEPAGLL